MKGCSVFLLMVLAIIAGLALGLLIGWVVWPVQWTDASPESMRASFRQEWVNMAIDSYSVNQDAALAAERFSYLGASGPADLAVAIASPRGVSRESAVAYASAVGQEVGSGNAPAAPEATTASFGERLLKPPLFGYVVIALFLSLLAIVLLVVLVIRLFGGGKKAPQETAAVIEEAPPAETLPAEALVEPEPVTEEREVSAVEAMAAGAVAAGLVAAADQADEVEAPESPAMTEEPVEVSAVTSEVTGEADLPVETRSGSAAGILATGAVVAGLVSQADSSATEDESAAAEAAVVESIVTDEQPVETSEVVRAVEQVASGDAGFDGVVSTFQDAVQETETEERGGAGGLGAVAVVGAAAAGLDWALEGEADATAETGEQAAVVSSVNEWTAEAAADELTLEEPPKDYLGKYNRQVIDIEGIGEAYAARLAEAGVTTTQSLLQQCATRKGREELADKTGISGKLILEWANHADMMRIQGIGPQWSDLLEMVGVNTVREMALRNAENLYQKLVKTNDEKGLVRQLPTLPQVEDWIEQAKDLPRILTY